MAIVKCLECDKDVSSKASMCVGCGAPMERSTAAYAQDVSEAALGAPARVEEELYCRYGVLVSTARVVFPGRTYATANISSVAVRKAVDSPSRQSPVALIVGGGLLLAISLKANSSSGGLFALIVAGMGIAWVAGLKTKVTYKVYVGSTGGESEALEHSDRAVIEEVAAALNRAMVRRG